MKRSHETREDLLEEIAVLRTRLEEAEETLRAIREGEVDALVVSRPEGDQVYTLEGADYSYRILVETINEGTATLGPGGHILYANRQLAEILGTPLERLIGTTIWDYVETADQSLFAALLSQGRQGDSKGEVSFRNRFGGVVPTYLSVKNFKLDEVPDALCLVVTDLTEQKRQEAILAEEQLSRVIFEQAEMAILVVDPEGRIIRASHISQQIRPENLLFEKFDRILPLETLDTAQNGLKGYKPFSINTVLQGKIYHGLEVIFFPEEGGRSDLLLNAGPLKSNSGEVLGAVVTLTDIKERKQAEAEREFLLENIQTQAEEVRQTNEELKCQAEELEIQADELRERNKELDTLMRKLRESEERYRKLVELSPDGIVVHAEGKFIFINPAAARLFGASYPEELEGRKVLDLIHPHYRDLVAKRLKSALRGEQTELRALKIVRQDGQPVDVETAGQGIEYQGRPAGQVVIRDITERKRAEEALKRAHDELEQKVKDRTADLRQTVAQLQEEVIRRQQAEESLKESETRLRQLTSKLLTAQEEERGRLALELHDDLGQSLMVLKMQLRAVQKKMLPESSQTRKSLEQALNFINQIIERIRSLSRNLRPDILETIGLTTAVEQLFSELSYQDIQITLNLDDIQEVFSKEAQLNIYRIFQESFSNIAKHARATHVSVNIEKHNEGVTFQIEDNGRGFDHEKVVNGDISDRGLGLTAMTERARMLGGTLSIWSEEGQGAKITVVVPLLEQ